VLVELKQRVADLTLLDHHKTAQEDLIDLNFAIFDMHKSGAMLAWEFWHPGAPVPELIAYISDRDLWQFALPHSQEVFAAICSYPMDFQVWDSFDIATLKQEGAIILRLQKQLVSSMCDQVMFKEIAGYQVPVVNASTFFSDVPHELCLRYPDAPFAAYYVDRGDGKRQWGLRSIGEFDVSAIAKQFGGGGHHNAAGFTEERW
jgi:oligoribonuclease NrnB/cAMP/cGMP phosphodiesterase (DHH superfamily)